MVKILVRAKNAIRENLEDEEGTKVGYNRVEFHMVDLKGEDETIEVERDWLPPLLSRCGAGSLVRLGPFVYIIGGVGQQTDEEPPKSKQPAHLYYTGGARIDVRGGGGGGGEMLNEWRAAPIPIKNRTFPVCAPSTCGGKIYSFGSVLNFVEVLDPTAADGWKVLPPPPSHLSGCAVSMPAVPDPSNRRILVHLPRAGLYAFYPEDEGSGGRWECLYREVCRWAEVAAVANDLLFLHDFDFPGLLRVFDLATGTWFHVVWSHNDFDIHNYTSLQFDALFSLSADDTLCLASYAPSFHSDLGKSTTTINFLKFTARRSPTRPATLILSPLAFPSHLLESTSTVYNFLPITS